ncbi:MAG TPA: helix-turn-helix transcriptional regulator [Oculatellaceae cyanobacterium]|jgi:transcriptional regulator with XRE-family HTH domain
MKKQWFLGQYIDRLLQEKGWSRNRLVKETGISSGHITWLLNGYASGKPNPPSPSLDILLALSKALNVSPMKLIQAYQGKEPDSEFTREDRAAYEAEMVAWLKQLPPDILAKAFKEAHSQDELDQLMQKAKQPPKQDEG